MNGTQHSVDRFLLAGIILVLLMGVLSVYSASSFRGAEKYDDAACFVKKHVVRVILGIGALVLMSRIDYHKLRLFTPPMLFGMIFLLILVLMGNAFHGSHRSLQLFGKQLQPSEFMKLTVVLYLAAVFSKGKESSAFTRNTLMIHFWVVVGIVAMVFVEPDLGTSLVIFFGAMVLFYLGGVGWKRLGQMAAVLIPIVALGTMVFAHQRQRIVDFVASLGDSEAMSYQVKQSVIGLANGGLTGVGYGAGKQKLFFLPEPFSDFILASYGEEMGFLGLALLFLVILLILWRGIRIALRAPDRYGFLLASGITTMMMVNALINAGVVVNLIPTTGLPFPLFSYGGSAILMQMLSLGILLNISRKAIVPLREFTDNRSQSFQWAVQGE